MSPLHFLVLLALVLGPAAAAPPAQRGGGDSGGAGSSIFGGAKSKIGRGSKSTAFDPDKFREELEQLRALVFARQLRREELQMDMVDEAQVQAWFDTSDHDQNGWISYGEASHSLGLGRARFQAFDGDRDGRLDAYEFDELYMHAVVNVGRFVPPKPAPATQRQPTRTPLQLRNAYDSDLDRRVGRFELAQVLADYGRDTDPEDVLSALDASGDLELDLTELEGLNAILFPFDVTAEVVEAPEKKKPTTVDDLFGLTVPRGTSPGSTPSPPRIVGPVGHFRRLDLDGDGYISLQDLETLLRPVRSSIRPHTVINTLDRDGDFRLSEAEFLGSVGAPER